jgi:Protein of unknown function (DUF551)
MKKWGPDFTKRKKIKALLDPLIGDFSVRLGGSTSIDKNIEQWNTRAPGAWRPIETAPNDQRIIIGSFPKGCIDVTLVWPDFNKESFTMVSGDFYAPTHWMPLPPPPAERGKDKR